MKTRLMLLLLFLFAPVAYSQSPEPKSPTSASATIFQALGMSIMASILTVSILAVSRIVGRYALENYGYKLAFANIPDVSGEWRTENRDPGGNLMKETMCIKQRGTKLSGEIEYDIQFTDGRSPRRKTLRIYGVIRYEIVAFYYTNANRREKGSGSFCLALSKDGDVLKGKYTWFDVEEERIIAAEKDEYYLWTRKN